MHVKRLTGSMIPAASALLWMVAVGAAAQHQHTPPADSRPAAQAAAPEKAEQALKVGKKMDVEFRVETLVGDMRFQPGRYQLQHRVEGADHFVHFTEVTKGYGPSGAGGGATKAHPGEVKCRIETLDKKASRTTVYRVMEGATERVTKVVIAGENVAHLF